MHSWFNKGCFGHWELSNSKLLFGGHSGKSLHCLVCPIAATFTESAIHSVASGEATIPSYKWHSVCIFNDYVQKPNLWIISCPYKKNMQWLCESLRPASLKHKNPQRCKGLTLTGSPAYHCAVLSFRLKVLAAIQFRSRGEWWNLPYLAISPAFLNRECPEGLSE